MNNHPYTNVKDPDNFPPPAEIAETLDDVRGPTPPLPSWLEAMFSPVVCVSNDCDGSGCESCKPF